jgi:hypothetical protein
LMQTQQAVRVLTHRRQIYEIGARPPAGRRWPRRGLPDAAWPATPVRGPGVLTFNNSRYRELGMPAPGVGGRFLPCHGLASAMGCTFLAVGVGLGRILWRVPFACGASTRRRPSNFQRLGLDRSDEAHCGSRTGTRHFQPSFRFAGADGLADHVRRPRVPG